MFRENDSDEVKLSIANSLLEAVENLIEAIKYPKETQYDHMAVDVLAAEIKRLGSWMEVRKYTIPKDNEFLFVIMPPDTTGYELTAVAQSIRRTLKMKEEKLLIAAGEGIDLDLFREKYHDQIKTEVKEMVVDK
jgi:hypothetical protein